MKRKFAITATIAALFLASLGFATPVARPAAADCLEHHSPNPDVDWTPSDEIGEVVPVSSPWWSLEKISHFADEWNGE